MEIQDLIVKTPCMGFGRNRNKRIYEEHIIKFIKPIKGGLNGKRN